MRAYRPRSLQPRQSWSLIMTAGLITMTAWAAEPRSDELLLVDGYYPSARLTAIDPDGSFRFTTPAGPRTLLPGRFVRWATPPDLSVPSQLVLTGGSRLVLNEPWTGEAMLTLDDHGAVASTALLEKVRVAREQLHILMLRSPVDSSQTAHVFDRLQAWQAGGDLLYLTSGDSIEGHLLRIGPSGRPGYDGPSESGNPPARRSARQVVTFQTPAGRLDIRLSTVAGIAIGSDQPDTPSKPGMNRVIGPPTGAPPLAVGLRDGSWIVCRRLASREGRLHLETRSGLPLKCQNTQDIVAIQVLSQSTVDGQLVYLSDIEADDYQHRPYLDIPWDIQRDRNVLGDRLRAGGAIFPKGLALHSASRLVYQINPSRFERTRAGTTGPDIGNRWDRFEAQIAIDDAAEGGGSVIFRVLLGRNSGWQTAFSSDIIRGGDPPQRISVPLSDSDQIALEVDYADLGDERDYANWLDARLVRESPP